jgi:hypothetical protein
LQEREALKTQWKVEGFPTVILATATGQSLGYTGYLPNGPEAYVEHLKKLLAATPEDKIGADNPVSTIPWETVHLVLKSAAALGLLVMVGMRFIKR